MPLSINQFSQIKELFAEILGKEVYYNEFDDASLHVIWNCLTESSQLHPLLLRKISKDLVDVLQLLKKIFEKLRGSKFNSHGELRAEFTSSLILIKTRVSSIGTTVELNEKDEEEEEEEEGEEQEEIYGIYENNYDNDDNNNIEESQKESFYCRWGPDNPYDPSYLSSPVVVSQMLTYCCSCILRQIDQVSLGKKAPNCILPVLSNKMLLDYWNFALTMIDLLSDVWTCALKILDTANSIIEDCPCNIDEDDETKIINNSKPFFMEQEENSLWRFNAKLSKLLTTICSNTFFYVDIFILILNNANLLINEYGIHSTQSLKLK